MYTFALLDYHTACTPIFEQQSSVYSHTFIHATKSGNQVDQPDGPGCQPL